MDDNVALERGASEGTRHHFEFTRNPSQIDPDLRCLALARAKAGGSIRGLFLWSTAVWRGLGRRLHLIGECAFHLRGLLVLLRLPDLAIASDLSFCHR